MISVHSLFVCDANNKVQVGAHYVLTQIIQLDDAILNLRLVSGLLTLTSQVSGEMTVFFLKEFHLFLEIASIEFCKKKY